MGYKVFAETSSGRSISPTMHETPQQALGKAVELMAQALANVRIVDPDGRHRTPAEFASEMNDIAGRATGRDDFCDDRR